jgi:hypothetical protein
MTTREELTKPVVAIPKSNGLVQPKIATEEALAVLNKKPIKTVWGQAYGLPVYDRLPGIEQAYKIEAGPDSAYVYIAPNFQSRQGPGSIQPQRADSNGAVFIMENGTITWSQGQVEVPRLTVDVSLLNNGRGLEDGEYKAGYLMDYSVPAVPARSFAYQEDALLSEAYLAYASDRDVINHEDFAALTDEVSEAWWSKEDSKSGEYTDGAWYVLDFKEPVWPERIQFVSQPGERATAKLAVYCSDDAIIWDKQGQIEPVGNSWTFQNTMTTGVKKRYWRFFWWDGYVSVGNILYTGEALYEDARKNAPVSGALPFIDNLYEEIDQVHLLVATFVVKNQQILSIIDQRRFIQRKYEPVAQWLTSFEDLMLRCYFEDVEQYASLYMAPPTADYHFYQELDTNACSGGGFISVGDEPQPPLVPFPDVVELYYTALANPTIKYDPNSDIYVGQTEDFLAEDPDSFDIGTDGIIKIPGPGLITPRMVEELLAPTKDSDAANKFWTDSILNAGFTIDNGIY